MATGPGGPRNLLIGLIFLHLGSCEHEKIFGLMKSNVTLSPLKKADFKDITWKKDKDKVAEWQENSQPKYFGSFNGRAILDKNGNFTILNLMTSDESLYELESLNPPGNELKFLYVFRLHRFFIWMWMARSITRSLELSLIAVLLRKAKSTIVVPHTMLLFTAYNVLWVFTSLSSFKSFPAFLKSACSSFPLEQ
ncbi:lymphocyte function-associated antigen 3 isoform X3 [Macrotis lagotis]|uniref:lymphocyte function-associated antigen 3 isoform X3 n=1 Tax=Macrotis lagotis TaxID=92651 RepID=UPI003D68E7F4